MKAHQLPSWLRLLLLNLTLALIVGGCATQEKHSYNKDFNQNLPADPNYYIENINDNHFRITVEQGCTLSGTGRIIYVKQAAATVAGNEAKQRGWPAWNLNYVQDYDRGWMRVVVAEITRQNAAETSPEATK